MTADAPTILATSGGMVASARLAWEIGTLTDFAIDLAGVTGRAPRVCFLATAVGDSGATLATFYSAAQLRGLSASHLTVFPMPNVDDVEDFLCAQDVIWVGGGSVAGLLAMWRLHGIDVALRAAWQSGVVLTGVSAGSLCWHIGGATDSFGPQLKPFTNGLGLVPFSNAVHYDSEPQRRPLFHSLVSDGTLPPGYATDDGAGLLYRGTEFVEAITETDGAQAYWVEPGADGAVERPLDTRLLTS